MKFEIQRSHLFSAVQRVASAADRRSPMPILGSIKIEADETSGVTLTASDLTVTLCASVAADVEEPGSICIDAKALRDIVGTLSDGPVEVAKLDNNWLSLRYKRSEFKIHGYSTIDWPDAASLPQHSRHTVPSWALLDLIASTSYAVSTDESRLNLNGLYFEASVATTSPVIAVATDGHRLVKATVDCGELRRAISDSSGGCAIVPLRAIGEIVKAIGKRDEVEVVIRDGHLVVGSTDVMASIKLNNVSFPPYHQAIPKKHAEAISVDAQEMLGALRRAEVVAPEKTATVKIAAKGSSLKITCDNPDLGVASQEVDCEGLNNPIEIGFNARYLIEAIERVGSTGSVRLFFGGPLDAIKIQALGEGGEVNGSRVGVVMPMRV